MVTLPHPPRRAHLISFWVMLSVLGGMVLGGALMWALSDVWLGAVAGVSAGILMGGVGAMQPHLAAQAYRLWNNMARLYVRVTRVTIKLVCFYIVFVSVGWAGGSSVRFTQPARGESLWLPRASLSPATFASQGETETSPSSERGWMSEYLEWATQSGNAWAICLVPFLVVLAACEAEEETSLSTQMYTLF